MTEADDILTKIHRDFTTCSRCFGKTVSTKDHGALNHVPCSDSCGNLDISMESDPIDHRQATRRANNILERLEENNISIDTDVFKTAVKKKYETTPPEDLFIDALEYALGNKNPDELEPDTHDGRAQKRKTEDSDQEGDELDPIKTLAKSPVSEPVFDEIEDAGHIEDCIDRFETPNGMVDIIYITRPQAFKERTAVTDVGDHSRTKQADAVISSNQDTIKASPKRQFGRWKDDLDALMWHELLSAAILQLPLSSPAHRDEDRDRLRRSEIWPVVKEQVSQKLLGLMQRSDQEYFTTDDLCEMIELRDQAVKHVVSALNANDTITPTNDGWVYSGDEIEFNEERARSWQKDREP